MKKSTVGWLLFALIARAGSAQTSAKALQKLLKGKPLGLNSYSAEPVTHYDWMNGNIVVVPGRTFAVALFTTSSVQSKDGVITLTGKRALIVRNPKKGNLALAAGVPMRLDVDLHGAPESEVLPKMREMLFAEDLPDLIGSLPTPLRELREMMDFDIGEGKVGAGCGCTHILEDDEWIESNGNADYPLPRVTCQAEARDSEEVRKNEEARKNKVTRSVVLVVYVDDLGRVGNVWIVEPLGHGLDAKAVAAVRTYKFEPAKYRGKTIGAAFRIEINVGNLAS